MSTSSEFLKQMLEAGKKWSGGGQGIIGRIKIDFGLHRYVQGHSYWRFWKAANEPGDVDRVGDELRVRLQEAGSGDSPVFGVKITIDKNVLSRDEPYKSNLEEFVPKWQEDAFNLLLDHISQQKFPIGKFFYGKIEYKANPWNVKKGDAGKTGKDQEGNPSFPTIRIPVEMYASEQDARSAAGGSSSASATSDSQWSEKLRANYPDTTAFEKSFSEIQTAWGKISKGELPWDGAEALPQPSTPPKLKAYLANVYDCTAADIDIALEGIPF